MQSGKNIKPVILVGGKGKRLGTNKAYLSVNGKSVLRRTFLLLSEIFGSEPLLIGSNEVTGFSVIGDAVNGAGPLGGLYTAFLHTDEDFVFLTACDMPFIKKELLVAMREALPEDCDIFVPFYKDFTEPLFAFYNRRIFGKLREIVLSGKYFPVREILSCGKTEYFGENEIKKYDPEFLTFVNINTKEDYENASRIVSGNF